MDISSARFDLHSHTTASDGGLTPQALVHRACEFGVDVLAITDHDTIAGVTPAQEEIARANLPLRLVSGVEISSLWENHEIHIVGLNVDINDPHLTDFLASQSAFRQQRAALIGERLEKARIPGALQGAMRLANGGEITRAHFAQFLIEQGRATTLAGVFKHYLARGKTGYVPPQWCTLNEAIMAIHRAGGIAILAHPGRYQLSAKWLKRLLAYFSSAGGDAMEVAQCQQAPDERNQLGLYATQFQLLASQGSDFHRACPWIELGRRLHLPAGVTPVWQHPQWPFSE